MYAILSLNKNVLDLLILVHVCLITSTLSIHKLYIDGPYELLRRIPIVVCDMDPYNFSPWIRIRIRKQYFAKYPKVQGCGQTIL